MNLVDQIKKHKEISRKIEELEQTKKVLGQSIMAQMQSNSIRVSDFLVRRYQRLSIKLTVDEARSLNATKMEESVDKDKIKFLYNQGHRPQGVSETQYIVVTELIPNN